MTAPRRLEQDLPALLADLYMAGTPDYRDELVLQVARTPQRPAWMFPERWLPMDIATQRVPMARFPMRALGILALIGILIAASVAVYIGTQTRVPPPFGPAANGLIPYELNGDIYLGDPVTSDSRLLVGGPEAEVFPTFSPDGRSVMFGRETEAGFEIFVIDEDGSDLRSVSGGPLTGAGVGAWAADSLSIYQTHQVDGAYVIDAFDVTGSVAPRRVAELEDIDAIAFRPPSGSEILFRGKIDGVWALYSMQADGSSIVPLAAAHISGLPDQDLNFATYTPDGEHILFNRYDFVAERIQLWIMDADGENERVFVNDPLSVWEGEASVSPDGRWVAFWRQYEGEPPQPISVVRADGTGPVTVMGPALDGTAWYTWAPDSSRLLMVPNADVDTDVRRHYLLDPESGAWTTPAWEGPAVPDWQRKAE